MVPLEPVQAAAGAAVVCLPCRQHRAHQAVLPGTARPTANPRHVRRAGRFSEQWALLFRDYLRAHPATAAEYEAVKRRLALRLGDERHAYTDAKVPFMWQVIRQADDWAQTHGWLPGPSDIWVQINGLPVGDRSELHRAVRPDRGEAPAGPFDRCHAPFRFRAAGPSRPCGPHSAFRGAAPAAGPPVLARPVDGYLPSSSNSRQVEVACAIRRSLASVMRASASAVVRPREITVPSQRKMPEARVAGRRNLVVRSREV